MLNSYKITDDVALNLAGRVYEAALDEQEWPSFLEAFAQAVSGCSAMLRSVDLQTKSAGFVASAGYDPAWKAAYCDHFVKLDYLTPTLNQFGLCEVKTSDEIVSLSRQRKTEFFNDYSVPQDKVHGMGVNLLREDGHTLTFSAQRGKRAGAFGERETMLMNALAPHVTRAVQMRRRISSVTVEKEWALGALDRLRMGVILTNSSGKPLFVNLAAESILASSNGISVNHGNLALNAPSDTALLHKLIVNAAHGINGAAIGGDMRIAMPDRFRFLHCLVTPVSPKFSAGWDISVASGCAAIFLSEPGRLQLAPKRLAILYGLSPAESRLAAKLAEINSLEQAANGLGIAMGTARTQLAAVFGKTGARTQAELLVLLATGTLAYCRDGSNPGEDI